MKWTTEFPTKPGFYWVKNCVVENVLFYRQQLIDQQLQVAEVMPGRERYFTKLVRFFNKGQLTSDKIVSAEWYGPIDPPEQQQFGENMSNELIRKEEERMRVAAFKAVISDLPPHQEEACNELAEHVRRMVKDAGSPVGELAVSLVAAELLASLPDYPNITPSTRDPSLNPFKGS